jgi:hypothetical protein
MPPGRPNKPCRGAAEYRRKGATTVAPLSAMTNSRLPTSPVARSTLNYVTDPGIEDELGRELGKALDRDSATLDPTEFAQPLHKSGGAFDLVRRRGHAKETDGRQPRLRVHSERPYKPSSLRSMSSYICQGAALDLRSAYANPALPDSQGPQCDRAPAQAAARLRAQGASDKPGSSTTRTRPSGCCAIWPAGSSKRRPALLPVSSKGLTRC